jgi:hypothetical protein
VISRRVTARAHEAPPAGPSRLVSSPGDGFQPLSSSPGPTRPRLSAGGGFFAHNTLVSTKSVFTSDPPRTA